jgi:uncharacterized membrane protein YhaH (DUF805 family)
MARTLVAAALPQTERRQFPAAAALAALGVVYGDIGTSALYGFKQAAEAGGAVSPEATMGIVSVILWSLLLIVAFKYAILIMRADNRGEGGIVALLALLAARRAPPGSWHLLFSPSDGRRYRQGPGNGRLARADLCGHAPQRQPAGGLFRRAAGTGCRGRA